MLEYRTFGEVRLCSLVMASHRSRDRVAYPRGTALQAVRAVSASMWLFPLNSDSCQGAQQSDCLPGLEGRGALSVRSCWNGPVVRSELAPGFARLGLRLAQPGHPCGQDWASRYPLEALQTQNTRFVQAVSSRSVPCETSEVPAAPHWTILVYASILARFCTHNVKGI